MIDYLNDFGALLALELTNVARWGELMLDKLDSGEAYSSCRTEANLTRWANDAFNLTFSPYILPVEKRRVVAYLLTILPLDSMTLEPINVLVPQLTLGTNAAVRWQDVIGLDDHINSLLGSSAAGNDIYNVGASKRAQVADAIIAQVATGQQAYILEPDAKYLGKVIVDNRTPTARTIIICRKQVNPDTSTIEYCWYRSIAE